MKTLKIQCDNHVWRLCTMLWCDVLETLPSSVCISFPVVRSKMLIIPSLAPQAINFPSGLCKRKINIFTGDIAILIIFFTSIADQKENNSTLHSTFLMRNWLVSQSILHIDFFMLFSTELYFYLTYMSNTEGELSSCIKWRFFFTRFHTKNVDLSSMAARG